MGLGEEDGTRLVRPIYRARRNAPYPAHRPSLISGSRMRSRWSLGKGSAPPDGSEWPDRPRGGRAPMRRTLEAFAFIAAILLSGTSGAEESNASDVIGTQETAFALAAGVGSAYNL